MVEAVSKVTSTRQTEAVATAQEKVEKKAQKEETQKTKENDKVEEKKSTTMERSKVDRLVREYIEKLKEDNDYPVVHDKLDKWLLTYDIDKFLKTYPEIYSEMDLRTIMYNETISYL